VSPLAVSSPLAIDPPALLCLGAGLILISSVHSALLWLGHRREAGLGHVLLASALQGLGLLACLAGPAGSAALVNALLLAGAGYGLWALRRYAGLPARMNRWAWLALGAWILVAFAFHAMGFRWVRGLAVPATLAMLVLGMSQQLGRLGRKTEFRAPAQVGAGVAVVLALAALGAGATAAFFPLESEAFPPHVRAWFFFAILGAHQVSTFLLAQVQAQRLRGRLEGLAGVDPLTGLASARGFRDRLDRAVGRSLRTGKPTSIMVLELDGYAALVQEHGPAPLERILEAFAFTLNRTLREADLPGRLEGHRFIALLHQTQPFEALLAAERLRAAWENVPLALGSFAVRATLSGGVASTLETVSGSEDLLALALDRAASVSGSGGNNVAGAEQGVDAPH
jgi:diguanylate cyclase (GGDEF)-like protein